ncbi:chitinase [Labrys sp. WJW]|uniref:glycoside hydrolase family 19 protein n=1 Tax=Labrys sp. WJW TaxID=1737983 RepID=UPI0008350A13|nr:chitinase [Labrys sp. WJW]OCC05095.1 chitinase [Labrys sp. WJW]
MTPVTLDIIRKIAGPLSSAQVANANSVIAGLNAYGARLGLDQPHRIAHYLAQDLHESGAFKWDREIWGPTPAQKKYEGRADLGNTQPGDGHRFMGRTGIQITGRANTAAFRDWCRKNIDPNTPDFEAKPDLMNTDPWEGVGPLWYWSTRGLNRYADRNDIETITKKINGGLNGFADRLDWYAKVALVLLGYGPNDVRQFQTAAKLSPVDGDAGPRTRAALHTALVNLTKATARTADVQAAPVQVEKTVTVPVPVDRPTVPVEVDKAVKRRTGLGGWLLGIGGGVGSALSGLLGADWQTVLAIGGVALVALVVVLLLRHQIVGVLQDVRADVEG